MKQPKINEASCLGCGTCVGLCPTTFAIEGAAAKVINPTGNTEAEIDTAIASCPTQSIVWEETAA
jgi:ferredoxin